ncbi:hypothetical protein QW180_10905 [Vibrio sinaloensis]|nr:hypothetical protein [Vibrio sinaloensis]
MLGSSVLLVDSGKAIARRVQALLGVEKQEWSGRREIFLDGSPLGKREHLIAH